LEVNIPFGGREFGVRRIYIVAIFMPKAGLYSNPATGSPLRGHRAGPIGVMTSVCGEAN